jgi:hypothetical protein
MPPPRILPALCLLASAASLLSCRKPPPPPTPRPATPVSRAVDFLASCGPGGLWRSTSTEVLGSGQALTPFVLYALSHAPAETLDRHRPLIEQALDRLPLGGNEYPSYSLALSILALRRLRPAQDVSSLVRKLRSKQLTEELGWSQSDPEYGGWDEGVIPARRPQCQRPNLSVTAFACEALGGDPKAALFAKRCKAADGGFLFTPNSLSAYQNKAGRNGYATATFDALRILVPQDPDWASVLRTRDLPPWLDLPEEWGRAMMYYKLFAEAKVGPSPLIARILLAHQQADGSWANTNRLMKEDEPLVATGLALIAMCLCR